MSIFIVPFTIGSILTFQKTDKNCRCDEYYIILNSKDVTLFFSDMGRLFSSSSLASLRLHLGDRTIMSSLFLLRSAHLIKTRGHAWVA